MQASGCVVHAPSVDHASSLPSSDSLLPYRFTQVSNDNHVILAEGWAFVATAADDSKPAGSPSLTQTPGVPVRPVDLGTSWEVVTDGARLGGVRADAVVGLNAAEHERRQLAGLGALTELALLKGCMNLPLNVSVRSADLAEQDQAVLSRAPQSVVDVAGGFMTRRIRSVMAVHAVMLTGTRWTALLARASAFCGVAQRVVVLTSGPSDLSQRLWEAQLQGIGIWIDNGSDVVELLAPEVFVPRLIKPARWRFQENAYSCWLKAAGLWKWSGAAAGRPVPPAAEASSPLPGLLPLG